MSNAFFLIGPAVAAELGVASVAADEIYQPASERQKGPT